MTDDQMDYTGVPHNLDFLGIPVDMTSDPENKDLKEVFYDCTLLYYVWSLVTQELLEIQQVNPTDELIQRALYLHNAVSLIFCRLTTLYLTLACRLVEEPGIKLNISHEHECVYIELPTPASPHPQITHVRCYAYLPTCYLPSVADSTGKLWISLGGLPSGTRILTGQSWLTVQ